MSRHWFCRSFHARCSLRLALMCVIDWNCSSASSSDQVGSCGLSGASKLGVAVSCSETAPTMALKLRKPPPSLPRDGRPDHECGFALTQSQSRLQRALECCASVRAARKAKRSARCARLAGEQLVLAADAGGKTRARDPLGHAGGSPSTLRGSRAAQDKVVTMPDGLTVLSG